MRVVIYFDVYPGIKPEQVIPFVNACGMSKFEGNIRYRVDVEIPDPELPDKVIVAEAKPE